MPSLRTRLSEASLTIGTWLAIGSSHSAEVMGQVGFDWVIIDTQHGGVSEAGLLPIVQALGLSSTPAFVRVNWLDPALIMRAVDLGAAGVVVPMVNTADAAASAVRAVRYPPDGIRSFGPVRSYYAVDGAREEPLCIAMIETAEAMANLEAIAATPGLDGLLVGPVDLALSMGLGLSLEMPEQVLDAIERVANVCRDHELIAASVAFGRTNAEEQIRRGVTFLTCGADTLFMKRAAGEELAALRQMKPKV